VVQGACLVWGHNSCRLPAYTGELRYNLLRYIELRDLTADLQVRLVTERDLGE